MRIRRTLFNFIGQTYKWLYGTLDSRDEEYCDKTINPVKNNQQTIHDKLANQITLSKNIYDRLSKSLTTIYRNQNALT